jgi:HSP20 family molecular chaperone IbpA
MEFAGDPDNVRVYRTKQVRQWRITFQPREVHTLFDELIHRRWGRAAWQPRVDVLRIASGYVIEADVPGVDEDSIEITVRGRNVTMNGRRVTRRSEVHTAVLLCERPDGPFSRVIQFNEIVEGFRVQKSMGKGVMTLILTRT